MMIFVWLIMDFLLVYVLKCHFSVVAESPALQGYALLWVWMLCVAQLQIEVMTFITTKFDPKLTFWNIAIMPSETFSSSIIGYRI